MTTPPDDEIRGVPVPAPRRATREHPPIGQRLRDERHARGLSLRHLADRLGVSSSLISQIETGRARPSVSTLYALASELNVSLDDLLFPEAERGAVAGEVGEVGEGDGGPDGPGAGREGATARPHPEPVVREADRKRIRLASGVMWERLTAVSDPELEFLYVTYDVGGASGPEQEFQRHGGHEWGFVVSGTLGVTIGFDDHVLGPGDAVTFDSTTPHRLVNRGAEPVHAIWCVLGRHSVEVDRLATRASGAGRASGADIGATRGDGRR